MSQRPSKSSPRRQRSSRAPARRGFLSPLRLERLEDRRVLAGEFTDISAGLTDVFQSSVAWGDYDNDGDLDILLTGQDSDGTRISRVYQYSSGTFADISAGLIGVAHSSVAWGDYDNDGDLDILQTGFDSGFNRISRVYQNNGSTFNSVPAAPSGLTATIDSATSVTLAWTAPTDTQTPSTGLSYNLRVGTTPGGSEIVGSMSFQNPPSSQTDGLRKIAQRGLVQGTSWTLENLTPCQTYYWSIQAIDTVLAASPFAAEDTLSIDCDFGDAPDTYKSLLTSNGAGHLLASGLFLGAGVDAEPDGQPTATADGDDTNGTDDEDGVSFGTLRQGRQTGVTVVASTAGRLDAFVDFNADGDFADTGEKIFDNLSVAAGSNDLAFRVPSTAAASGTFARFRISATGGLTFNGLAGDGEVEDYAVRIKQGTDLGDAPNTYLTTLATNGARHLLGSALYLGAVVDGDVDGQPDATATGDDLIHTPNDEDGVMFGTLVVGQIASVTVVASAAGQLDAFADFDIDGNFADAGEKIFDNVAVLAGANMLNFLVPISATSGQTFFRFRVSTAGGLSFNGSATDGEVEDHTANIQAAELLLAEGGEASPGSRVESLEPDQLAPIVDAAIMRLASQGLSPQQLRVLSSVSFAFADLPGATLGLATTRTITLDANATGYGWFIDPTPLDDSEFRSDSRLSTLGSQLRMDLLTAVMHELGHTLGHDDLDPLSQQDDLMSATLAPGVRHTTFRDAADAVFAEPLPASWR